MDIWLEWPEALLKFFVYNLLFLAKNLVLGAGGPAQNFCSYASSLVSSFGLVGRRLCSNFCGLSPLLLSKNFGFGGRRLCSNFCSLILLLLSRDSVLVAGGSPQIWVGYIVFLLCIVASCGLANLSGCWLGFC